MSDRIVNARTPGSTDWRLHGYRNTPDGIVCEVITPAGARIYEPLETFVQNISNRGAWDNNIEDLQGMVDLARAKGVATEGGSHD